MSSMTSATTSPTNSSPSSPLIRPRHGMEQHGQHLFSLPSSPRSSRRNSLVGGQSGDQSISAKTCKSESSESSNAGECNRSAAMASAAHTRNSLPTSCPSTTTDLRPVHRPTHSDGHIPLASAISGSSQTNLYNASAWSLLAIDRQEKPVGMVLIALYHCSSEMLFTWPMQTDPNAAQPKQGTVFINKRHGTPSGDTADDAKGDGKQKAPSSDSDILSESLRLLRVIVMTWMMSQRSRSTGRRKLGESAADIPELTNALGLVTLDAAESKQILEIQSVRPAFEWSKTSPPATPGLQRDSPPLFAPQPVRVGAPRAPPTSSAAPPAQSQQTTSHHRAPSAPSNIDRPAKTRTASPLSSASTTAPAQDTGSVSKGRQKGRPIFRMLQNIANAGNAPGTKGRKSPASPSRSSPLSSSPSLAPMSILRTTSSPSSVQSGRLDTTSLSNVPSIEISSPATTEGLAAWSVPQHLPGTITTGPASSRA